jgi:hypothetical protein
MVGKKCLNILKFISYLIPKKSLQSKIQNSRHVLKSGAVGVSVITPTILNLGE